MVARGLLLGVGLFLFLFLAIWPLAPVLMPVAVPLRFWLVTLAIIPIHLLAGAAVRWLGGPAWARPLQIGAAVQVALLLAFRLSLDAGGESYNPIAFGPPGLLLALFGPILGGMLGARLPRWEARRLSPEGRVAFLVASAWVVMEFWLRAAAGLLLGPRLGDYLTADQLAILPAFPLIALAIGRFALARGLGREHWDLRARPAGLLAGIAAGLGVVLLLPVTARVDGWLFAQAGATPAARAIPVPPPVRVWVLLLTANGLVVPVTEELAWRGVVQTGLTRALGTAGGILITALLFAFKHVLVDASLRRLTTLLVVALTLCLVRWRWGTGASIAAHIAMNLCSSVIVLLLAR